MIGTLAFLGTCWCLGKAGQAERHPGLLEVWPEEQPSVLRGSVEKQTGLTAKQS